jgi:branched-chain amino acid transport system ATP-binding protein
MAELLRLDDVVAGYGQARVLDRISLSLEKGQSLALLGRNGTGKTTLVNTIAGVTWRYSGSIHLDGVDITRLRPDQRARAGIGWVPQERNIFRSLNVEENLTAVMRPGPWDVKRVWRMFPRLEERKANFGNQLSGGEQQMLAIARALVLNPKLILFDEPTEGLAPIIVDDLLRLLGQLFRQDGMTGIVVEQHAQKILGLTDRAVILDRGTIVHAASSAELKNDQAALARYLGITGRKPTSVSGPP